MACCPFHEDKHPSMKIDDNYYCFACGAKGDAVDYVARLFSLSQYEASKKINQDFHLGISFRKNHISRPRSQIEKPKQTKEQRAEKVHRKIDEWVAYAIDVLIRYLHWIVFWKEFYKPETMDTEWHPLFMEALQNEAKVNYDLDILMSGDGYEILYFFKNGRKEVERIDERVNEYQRGIIVELRSCC